MNALGFIMAYDLPLVLCIRDGSTVIHTVAPASTFKAILPEDLYTRLLHSVETKKKGQVCLIFLAEGGAALVERMSIGVAGG